MILVDTNVWSELTKPTREPRVVEWLRAHDGQTILSTNTSYALLLQGSAAGNRVANLTASTERSSVGV